MGRTRQHRARTPEEQENILINMAVDLAEKKLRDGTASSQLICLLLNLGTEKKRLENEKLRSETLLAEARVDQIKAAAETQEKYNAVIEAFKKYSGATDQGYDEPYVEDW